MRPQDERDLRTVLHEEAERHQPDREAMLDRIGRARTAPAPRSRARLLRSTIVAALPRPVAAAAAVATVLVLAVAGVRLANRSTPPPNPAAATATPAASPTPMPTRPAVRTGAPASPTSRPAGRASTSLGPATTGTPATQPAVRDGYLGATAVLDPHSNQAWTQSNLTLTTTATITALTVVVRIDRTGGVTDAGHWSSVPVALMTGAVDVQSTVIVYRFTLNTGSTLAPGNYVFAVQFNHAATARTPARDTYAATAYAARASSSASPTAAPPTGSARKAEVAGAYSGG